MLRPRARSHLNIHMFHPFTRICRQLIVFFLIVLLSGCAVRDHLTFLPGFAPQAASKQPAADDADDADLPLVSAESTVCLKQELAALKATGNWDDRTSPVKPSRGYASVHYDFPVTMNKQVKMYIDLFRHRQHKLFQYWLSRSTKYLPYIRRQLQQAGLPRDLAYLSMIESGFSQRACSQASAVGLWQFMASTGRQYDLTTNKYIDERRNVEKSTTAAIALLRDLYDNFGDWYLAVAAYNAGAGKISYGLRKYKVNNFWDLAKHGYLNLETRRYVPKLIATILIAKQPAKYGFTNIDYIDPLTYETLQVGPNMSLQAIALLCGSRIDAVKELNQELRLGKTPPNRKHFTVKIPVGTKLLAEKNLKRLHSYVSTGYKSHTLKKGESIASVCRHYDINSATLLRVNGLRSPRIAVGTHLRIPYSTVKYALLPKGNSRRLAALRDSLVLHRIKRGETISKIAHQYRVPQEMILTWNGLKDPRRIRAGQQLALYIKDEGGHLASSRKTGKRSQIQLAASNQPSIDTTLPVFTAQKKSAPDDSDEVEESFSWYRVKDGDSLWTISQKFNTTASLIRKWNNLKSNLIHPGSRLLLKDV